MPPDEPTQDVPRPLSSVSLVTPLNQHATDGPSETIRVLHVDDEPNFTEMTARFLERIGDEFTVLTAPGAEAGLDRLAEESIDCIVCDYQMPKMNGLDFLDAVRDRDPDFPFILFTGKGSEEIASEAIAAGVTGYLQKEVGTDQYEVLANRIRNAVEQRRTERELWRTLSWYQRLVEQELAGIYLIQHGEFVYVNEKFADIFGYEQGELIGQSSLEVIAEEDHERVIDNLQRRESGEVDNIRYSLTGRRKDGERLDIEVHGGEIEFEDQPAVLGVLLDVTDGD